MRDNWSQSPIQEVTSLIKDGTHSTHKDVPNGIPMLSAKDIVGGKVLIPDDARLIPETDFLQIHKSYKLQENDVLLTLVGTIGRVALLRDYSTKFTCQRSVGIVRFNDRVNSLYAYYYISSESFLKDLIRSMNASAQGGVYLGELGKINISFPKNISQQQKIAQILSTCDAVIEKTEAAIAKYQAMKQGMMHDLFTRGIDVNTGKLRPKQEDAPQLYKESELGWIPKEWEVKRLEDFGFINYGKDYKSNPFGDQIPIYGTGGIMGKTSKSLNSGPAVLTGRKGTINRPIYVEGDFWNVDTIFCIKTDSSTNIKWFYYQLVSKDLNKLNEATGVPSVNSTTLNKLNFMKPELSEQNEITKRINKIDDKLQTEQSALSKYQQLKTGLMQDLLSGKVEVKV